MVKIKSLEDLNKLRDQALAKNDLISNPKSPEASIQVKVGMGTSGIASGAKNVMDFLMEALEKRNIEAIVTRTGDMGYSYAEPTIEIKKPGKDPVVFGDVDLKKADLIIEKYIKLDQEIEGIISVNYRTIED